MSQKDKKCTPKKTSSPSYNSPKAISSNPSSSKTLIGSNNIEYNIVEDMNKNKENISLFEVSMMKKQRKLLLNALSATPNSPFP